MIEAEGEDSEASPITPGLVTGTEGRSGKKV